MAIPKPRNRRLAAASLLIAGIGAAPPCGGEVAEIRERGKLVMLSFPHQESFFVRTNLALGPMPQAGTADHFQGIDVDLMLRFAESLGVALEIRPVSQPSYGALIPDLLHGRGDVIASSFSITAARREKVDFTEPYFSVYLEFVVRLDSPISTVEDLTGRQAAILKGSSHEEHLRRMGVAPQQILQVEFNHENYLAVLEGDADYTLADSISVMRLLSGRPQLKVAFRLPERDDYGFAVRRGSDLRQHLNRFLAQLRETGDLERIVRRHVIPAGGEERVEPGRPEVSLPAAREAEREAVRAAELALSQAVADHDGERLKALIAPQARRDEGPWQAVAESYLPPAPGAKPEPAARPAACPVAPEDDLARRRALGNAGRDFARSVEIDDVELFKSRVAPDAYFLGSRDSYHGPAEVAAAWSPFLDPESGHELYWEPREVFVAASGELGYTIGDWVRHQPGADARPVVTTGQYLSVWRRNDEGRWQNTADTTLTVRDPLPADFSLDRHRAAVSWMAPLVSPAATVSHQRQAWQVGISAAGDFAYAVGNYVDRISDGAGHNHVAAGSFLTAWRRDAAGAWKVVAEGVRPPPSREE